MKSLRRHEQSGVSLIEALVALAVMAFGILGVVGVQATLRSNADLSRQRAEAVRIAGQTVESWRAFTTLSPNGTQTAYNSLVSQAATQVDDPNLIINKDSNFSWSDLNTTYWVQQTVTDAPVGRAKTLQVNLSWTDRANLSQDVSLSTVIFGTAPELAGSLALPGDASPDQQASGRNAAIPLGALDNGDGTSNFSPPGSSGLTWVFNNITGVITSICNPSCVTANSFLVSGYLNFALDDTPSASAPFSQPLLRPSGTSGVTVLVNVTTPALGVLGCFHEVVTGTPGYVAYFCAIPVPVPPAAQRWSGHSYLRFSSSLSPRALSVSLSDTTSTNLKVCRYTAAATDTPPNNSDHPYNYVNVISPLISQNFLVVSAPFVTAVTGAGSCPIDGNPQVITYRHQPQS